MRYLCLIYLDEKQLAAMPESEMNKLNARHLERGVWRQAGFHIRGDRVPVLHCSHCRDTSAGADEEIPSRDRQ